MRTDGSKTPLFYRAGVFGWLAALALLAAPLLSASCSAPGHGDKTAANRLVRLSDDEVKSLDPQKASDLTSLRIAADQFEGLTRYRGDGRVEPGLARSWTKTPDGLLWRFYLRPGLRFSDGQPITAGTFVTVFNRLRHPATASPNSSLFDVIARIEASGSDTVDVTLHYPFPALAELLAHPAMTALPVHRIASIGESWTNDRPLVTSGAYRMTNWTLHDRLLLERNPRWHDQPAPIAAVEWKPVDDRQSAFRQFRAGEADLVGDFPSEQKQWLDRHHPGSAKVAPYRGAYYFVFNTRRPPFNDRRVRQALNMMVERRAIAGRLLGIGNPPAWGVVPPGMPGTSPAFRPGWTNLPRAQRMAQARQLLADAGYDGRRPLRFEIRFNSDTDHRRVALALLDNWRDLPVRVTLLNTEATLHFASMRRGDFDLARAGWIGDLSAPENFLGVHRSDAGAINYSGYANPAFDLMLQQALATPGEDRRSAGMKSAEAILMADAPVLPVYYYVTKNLVSPRVLGWQNNLANVHPSRTLRLKGS